LVPAEFIEFSRETALKKASFTTPEWPIAFARLKVSPEAFLSDFPCNHIHGVYGDYVDELIMVAKILGIDVKLYV
jgi:L-fucose isomerase